MAASSPLFVEDAASPDASARAEPPNAPGLWGNIHKQSVKPAIQAAVIPPSLAVVPISNRPWHGRIGRAAYVQ